MCDERVRLHGLDLSTKHVVSDSREPEMKKPRRIARLYICGRLDRRYDRGTGAMHLANTPVVSPESKKPLKGAFHRIKFFASHRCHRGAALLSIFELSKFLVCFQYKNE
ncbi:hypothetical protein D4S77_17685 [Salmonella enterica]|nr:hypothetical protein [Salmonella enterica]EBV6524715.1 hypothetical protein [Salmonella enterica subsp. enterica serovar Anatum]EDW2027982.1 hypothetical protein [Salmonella enterica subsp. enterica]HAU4324361.1 hypothetical protein [Citrobacter freundii]EBC2559129.1 hypothetical protein [Salmonella enterica]